MYTILSLLFCVCITDSYSRYFLLVCYRREVLLFLALYRAGTEDLPEATDRRLHGYPHHGVSSAGVQRPEQIFPAGED